MYVFEPLGINTRQNDRLVADGFLQESINLQQRDGTLKLIPNRILSEINTTLYGGIILHKVADEDQVNVLGFSRSSYGFLAEDLGAYLGGGEDTLNGDLTWFGTITDGQYMPITPIVLAVKKTAGMSWTILNGILYFMGDGSTAEERYYLRLQYNEAGSAYETKDMYAWKTLVPFYPTQVSISMFAPKKTYHLMSQCGFILTRITLVLKTGEEVLHSPVYFNYLYGLNRADATITTETAIDNIHTMVNMNFEFTDNDLFAEEISAINIYSSTPYYIEKIPVNCIKTHAISNYDQTILFDPLTCSSEVQKKAEEPFYLVKTIDKPTTDQLLLSVGKVDPDITFKYFDDSSVIYSEINISTIAAGQVMPVDNFSYHKIYGRITSFNGRLVVETPTTVISEGSMRALSMKKTGSQISFKLDTEDGTIQQVVAISTSVSSNAIPLEAECRGLLSYPDLTASSIGVKDYDLVALPMLLYKTRKNKLHNMSCSFNFYISGESIMSFTLSDDNAWFVSKYYGSFTHRYENGTFDQNTWPTSYYYNSNNRVQFSAIGEFSVWPAVNSYRVGDGKIMRAGANNVDQKSANLLSMLIVGTTSGIWAINTDPTGNNFISSVTRISFTPYISKEVLQVGNILFFIGDKGLMAMVGGGEPESLSYNFFPGQGDNDYPEGNEVLPNYSILTQDYFNGTTNIYTLKDIVTYLKGAKLLYDNKRNAVWCSNPDEEFSLIYDITNKRWGMSTTVFSEAIELFGSITTNFGNIQSWYLAMDSNQLQPYLMIMSGENMEEEVFFHMLTRPVKFLNGERHDKIVDCYKKIQRMFVRCEIYRDTPATGYFKFGLWGKQDLNQYKANIPLVAISDNRAVSFPDNVRQDIPIGSRKGKYKAITLLIGGKALPDSSIDRIDIVETLVDNTLMR